MGRRRCATSAAGQLIGQPGDREEWGKRLARQFYREGSDPEGAVRRGLFEAIWRFDHVYDSFTVPRRYGPHYIKTGRIAAVAEEARRKWQAEGLAPADVFWVRNRRNTGLVLVTPNPDPRAPAVPMPEDLAPEAPDQDILSRQGAETLTGQADIGFGAPPQLVQANPQQQPEQPSMTADALFNSYRQKLAIWEGGIANRPRSADKGGITNKGISEVFLGELKKLPGYRHLPDDPRKLTDAQIDFIFRAEKFDRPQIWKLAQVPGLLMHTPQLVEQVFDAGVQHGISDPGKWLQQALDETLGTDLRTVLNGTLDYDGIIGSGTRKVVEQAVNAGRIGEVNDLIVDKRIAHMKAQPEFKSNPGWVPRAESFRIGGASP